MLLVYNVSALQASDARARPTQSNVDICPGRPRSPYQADFPLELHLDASKDGTRLSICMASIAHLSKTAKEDNEGKMVVAKHGRSQTAS